MTEAGVRLEVGDKVTLGYQAGNDEGFQYYFNDFQRRVPLVALAALFAVAVIALGRWQGLRALVALGLTGVLMVAFLFPSILDGHSPTAVALVSAAVIAILALYLTHGVTEMITVALLGTFAALALTAVLAAVFSGFARFTGYATAGAWPAVRTNGTSGGAGGDGGAVLGPVRPSGARRLVSRALSAPRRMTASPTVIIGAA